MRARGVFLGIMLLGLIAVPARAEDFCGRVLPDQPGNFIFGYGSLINSASRNATAGRPIPAIPVRVSAAFDAREQGYARVEVPRADIQAISWEGLPDQGRIWVYVPDVAGEAPGVGLPPADARFPMLESYIDVVVEGGLEYGPGFAREIIETTKDWSRYWLNDRELARRPWVFDHQSAVVDQLLAAVAPHFADRMLSEDYAAKYLLGTCA